MQTIVYHSKARKTMCGMGTFCLIGMISFQLTMQNSDWMNLTPYLVNNWEGNGKVAAKKIARCLISKHINLLIVMFLIMTLKPLLAGI